MLKFHTLLILLFVSNVGFAQKKLNKIFDGKEIDTITVNGDGIYSITLLSVPNQEIVLNATIEGETYENLLITEKRDFNAITFSLENTPFFIPENDKLAVHKVIAVHLIITIPENKTVNVNSDIAILQGSGKFKHLEVKLKQGDCLITTFLGNGDFQTLEGDITVVADSKVSGKAISQRGTVSNTLITNQYLQIKAESKHGNIYLTQTEY